MVLMARHIDVGPRDSSAVDVVEVLGHVADGVALLVESYRTASACVALPLRSRAKLLAQMEACGSSLTAAIICLADIPEEDSLSDGVWWASVLEIELDGGDD